MTHPFEVTFRIVEIFEELEVEYHLGGSFASSLHGVPRQTHDVDLVADLSLHKAARFAARLSADFYADLPMIAAALQAGRSFNVIHLATGFKVDVFPKGSLPFDLSEFQRHRPHRLLAESSREVVVKSPEDTLLRKLQWYRLGNMVSDRQWNDILGILRVQRGRLDFDYLRRWASELEVADLLEKAEGALEVPPSDRD